MKPIFKIILPILLAFTTAGLILVWDIFFKDKIDTVEVVVVKAGKSIDTKEEISKGKLVVERRQRKDLLDNTVLASDISEVIGKDSKSFIAGNSIVTYDMIDTEGLIPDEKEGESIVPIPQDWIFARPSSLRRKDRVDIYIVPNSAPSVTGEVTEETQNFIDENGLSLKSFVKEPLLKDVVVVYAKDSSGNEVMSNAEVEPSSDGRLTSTGQIQELELILNTDDFKKLVAETVEKKARIYITYN